MSENVQATEFVQLLNESRSRLFGFIHALVINLDDAEDLYQQVVVVLWQKFGEYRPGSDFSSWAVRVAEFTVKNFVRRRRRSKVLFSEEIVERIIEDQSVVERRSHISRADALVRCLNRLPSEDRRLIALCYRGERRIHEVAESEGRTPDSLYSTLHRLRRILFNCIERTLRTEVGA
jgi:RNA polymerase sigma-70 factor (ECF subfamily)